MHKFMVLVDGTFDGESCENEIQAHNIAKTRCARANRPIVVMQVIGIYNPGEPVFVSAIAQPAAPAPAEPYEVGDVVEINGWSGTPDDSENWRKARIDAIDSTAHPFDCTFLDGPKKGADVSRKPSQVRRPATVAPAKFEPVAGARVRTVGAQSDDEQREGIVIHVSPPYVWVELSSGPHHNLAVRRIASQVHPI